MICGNLQAADSYQNLLAHEVWREAFEWIKSMPEGVSPGIRHLRGTDMYVNVHGYETLPASDCRFESHRRYLDLQYCISGGELIRWEQSSRLDPDGEYDSAKDVQFYHPSGSLSQLRMEPGSFAIFHPSDGHQPKIQDGNAKSVFKLVVKISRLLLEH